MMRFDAQSRISLLGSWCVSRLSYEWAEIRAGWWKLPLIFVVLWCLHHGYDISWSRSLSLPYPMWLNTRFPPATVSTGNYVVVDLPPAVAEHFPHGAYFVKQVVGVPGDVVVATGRDYVVIHDHTPVHVGRAKLMSRKGDALQAGPVGVIPPGYYFIRGTHPDSLDSRYAMMGWVPESSIIGAAVPILPAFTADWFVHWGWCQR